MPKRSRKQRQNSEAQVDLREESSGIPISMSKASKEQKQDIKQDIINGFRGINKDDKQRKRMKTIKEGEATEEQIKDADTCKKL